MPRKINLAILLSAASGLGLSAQNSQPASSAQSAFDAFRQSTLSNYQQYRKKIFEDYDKYLEGIWESYTDFKTNQKYKAPKPETAPTIESEPAPEPTPLVDIDVQPEATIPEPVIASIVPADAIPASLPKAPAATKPSSPNQVDLQRPSFDLTITPAPRRPIAIPAAASANKPDAPNQIGLQTPDRSVSVTPVTPGQTQLSPVAAADKPLAPNQVGLQTPDRSASVTPVAPGQTQLPPVAAADKPLAPNQVGLQTPDRSVSVTPVAPGQTQLPPVAAADKPDAPNQVGLQTPDRSVSVTPVAPGQTQLPPVAAADKPLAPNQVNIPAPELEWPEDVETGVVADDEYAFEYRGMILGVKDVPVNIRGSLSDPSQFATQWREMKAGGAPELAEAFTEVVKKYNLNDFLTYDVLKAYILDRYPGAHQSAQMALAHCVLAHMGYDIRLGLDDQSHAYLLIPFQQQVYQRHYLTLNGRQYYVFPVDSDDPNNHASGFISTCRLPEDADPGNTFDLHLTDLRLPEKPHDFSITQGGITISGQVNENLIPVLYRYPQMPTEDFAESVVSPALRADIVQQFKAQLAGKTEREAVDALLRFTQSGFKYATDDAYHGFEKPYFFEETLFYPKCDCEDRSIFYTYLLWNVLGVENHLIAYPVHEAAAVKLSEPISGDNYIHHGTTFYISDPTYIGARTGQCMPRFRKTAPTIDKEYK